MVKDFKTIVNDIEAHLLKSDRSYYSDFYVGITNDVQRRLFIEHNVLKEKSWWIYRTAIDCDTARKVEKYFLEKGMRGDTGGGNDESVIVYCYAVSPTTIE